MQNPSSSNPTSMTIRNLSETTMRHQSSTTPTPISPAMPTYESLCKPLPLWHPKSWYYRSLRLGLKTVGQLSNGIRLGYRYGFDSGVMLEYVYRNQPEGITPVGKVVDRLYLNAQGWQGIRLRGQLLQRILYHVLGTYQRQNVPCVLLDVACGGGRYDLEVLQHFPPGAITAILRDYKPENVAKTRELAAQFGLSVIAEQADAFSDADLDRVQPPPNVVVVSGLHEILPDDALIQHHFHQLYRRMASPGTLIFTIQPHHPQVELIARTLPAHTGEPWAMRLRPWEQTRQWAEAAGFRHLRVYQEPTGIFGVVTAAKP